MTIITFNTIETENEKKLLLEFPYDEDIINTIKKELPYSKTEYGYHKPDKTDSPLAGIYDSNCWFANFDTESFNAIEEHLETPIPTEYWDEIESNTTDKQSTDDETSAKNEVTQTSDEEENHPERVQITKTNKGRITIEPWGTTVESLVREAINAEFTTGDIDTDEFFTHIEKKTNVDQGTLPIGVYESVKEKLERIGVETVTVDNRSVDECKNISWRFTGEITPHQRDTVNEIIEQKNGIVLTATGNDKAAIACRVIYELNRDATIITTSKKRVEKWNEVINQFLAVGAEKTRQQKKPIRVVTYNDVIQLSADENVTTDIAVFDECQQKEVTKDVLEASLKCEAKYRIGMTPVRLRNNQTLFSEVLTGIGATELGYSMNNLQETGVIANITMSEEQGSVVDVFSTEKDTVVITDDKSEIPNIQHTLNEHNDGVNQTTVETIENVAKTQSYDEVILITQTGVSLREAQTILRAVNPEGDDKHIVYMVDDMGEKAIEQCRNTFNLLTEDNVTDAELSTNTATQKMKTAN